MELPITDRRLYFGSYLGTCLDPAKEIDSMWHCIGGQLNTLARGSVPCTVLKRLSCFEFKQWHCCQTQSISMSYRRNETRTWERIVQLS